MVTGQRIDAVEYHSRRRPMVPMPAGEVAVRATWVERDDQVGAPPPDLATDVAPQVTRVFQRAILVAEEFHALRSEHSGSLSLLHFPDRYQFRRRDAAIPRTLVPVGDDDVGDLPTFPGESSDRAASQEFRVIRMRSNAPPRAGGVRHELPPVSALAAARALARRRHCHAVPASRTAPARNGAERSKASARAPITSGPTTWPVSLIVRI